MHFREALAQALRTLRTERLRSFLTMFGVVWGTASVVFLLSWGIGVQRMLEDGLSRAGKNRRAWSGPGRSARTTRPPATGASSGSRAPTSSRCAGASGSR